MSIRRTTHNNHPLTVEPQAKRMFVMRAFTPKGHAGLLSDTTGVGEESTRDSLPWEDRVLRLYYQDIGAVPRLRVEEERELAQEIQQLIPAQSTLEAIVDPEELPTKLSGIGDLRRQ